MKEIRQNHEIIQVILKKKEYEKRKMEPKHG